MVDIPSRQMATFRFLEWQDIYDSERPYQILTAILEEAPEQRRSNLAFHDGPPQEVEDIRGQEGRFSLDHNGFQYITHHSQLSSNQFEDKELVEHKYFEECEKILREHLEDVNEVFFFDWRLRETEALDAEGKKVNLNDPTSRLPPARFVHVDQAPEGVLTRLKDHLGDRAEEKLNGRLRLVNIWRPINGPVRNWPLAVCDSNTIAPSKLVETDQVREAYAGVSLYAMYDEAMKWYFMNKQNDDEVLLLKMFDSADVPARNCPHSAFLQYDDDAEQLSSRQSIEVRAFVFT